MNLVNGDWVPVIYQNGRPALISLAKLFQDAESIRDLAANPPQRIALMRLLICIAQRSLDGPADEAEWQQCRPRIREASLSYLNEHADLFGLYGDRPFMQVPTLKPTHNAVLDKLDFGLASGNNATLFDHAASADGRNHSDAWIAVMLLTYLANSPGGKIGVTKWGDSSTQPGKNKGPGESEHAPCVDCSALHAFIRRADLLSTIHANLIAKDTADNLPNMSWGKPTWEIDRSQRDSADLHQSVTTYLGRLVPLTRAILLEKNCRTFTLANGINYPKFPECRETSATVAAKRDGGSAYVSTSLDRHPWRELGSLLAFGTNEGGPLCLQHLRRQREEGTIDIWTGGLAADKGKILDTAEWSFAAPLHMIGNDGPLAEYRGGVARAQKAQDALDWAVKDYASALKMEKAPKPKARIHFWSMLDRHYDILLSTANSDEMSLDDEWTPLLREAMRDAYQVACPCETPRQIQAYAAGQKRLKLANMKNR